MNTEALTGMNTEALTGMNLTQLLELNGQVNAALEAKREEEKPQVLEKIRMLTEQAGLSADEVASHLTGKAPKRSGPAKVKPKYRDPTNPANLWSGRGKRPKWLTTHLDAGGTLQECLIERGGGP